MFGLFLGKMNFPMQIKDSNCNTKPGMRGEPLADSQGRNRHAMMWLDYANVPSGKSLDWLASVSLCSTIDCHANARAHAGVGFFRE